MRRLMLWLVVVLVAAALAGGGFAAGLWVASPDEDLQGVLDAAEEVRERSAKPVSTEDLIRAAERGMLAALGDPYAAFLDPAQAREVRLLDAGAFVGLGLWLAEGPGGPVVSSVLPGSPAARADVAPGDVLLTVDGRSVDALPVPEVTELLGGPEGAGVTLGLARGGRAREVRLIRSTISLTDVGARMLSGDVAYAHPLHFAEGTAEALRDELAGLLNEGASGVILDLRGNPGGLLNEAIATAGLFLDGGPVAVVVEDGEERTVEASGDPLPETPLTVVVDGGTAGAAELVAAALQERDRAPLVGVQTFGKGAVTASVVVEGGEVRITVAEFLTPRGRSVEGVGLVPDIPVVAGGPIDAQLDRAVRAVLGEP